MPQPQMSRVIRFGVFELEPQVGILRKHGVRIRLQEQPFRVLLALIEKRGEIVTREELRDRIWSGAAYGDYDHSLNIAVNKIREALGDSADTPRFVETLPRRGYRFIAPIEGGSAPVAPPPVVASRPARRPNWVLAGAGLLIGGLVVGVVIWLSTAAAPPQLEWRRLTNDGSFKTAPVLSDGARLYYRAGTTTAGVHIMQVPLSGGEARALPIAGLADGAYRVLDVTPDGQELLFAGVKHMLEDFELRDDVTDLQTGPLWTGRIVDGSALRVGSLLAREARYSPDGKQVAFTSGGTRSPRSLWLASADGSNPRQLLEVKDFDIVLPTWSADGRRIAFGQLDRSTEQRSAWEIGVEGGRSRRLAPGFQRNHLPAAWTADGSVLLISDGQFWIAPSRRFFQFRRPLPIQLSTGDPLFAVPIHLGRGGAFYSVGTTQLGELQRFNMRSRSWEPQLGGISAEDVEYSRDGQSVVYVSYPQGELWVRRADGSRPIQLTQGPMQVAVARWSPDSRMVAFSARSAPDQPWHMYLVDATGGSVRSACPKECRGLDLAWMPDGKKIVFAAPVTFFETDPAYLRLLDLATGAVSKFPGSEGLHSPRVSPDGSTMAALVYDGSPELLLLYHFSEKTWTKLPYPGPYGPSWPSWSRDSQSIWYYNYVRQQIMRVRLSDNRHEVIAPLKVADMTGFIGAWFNITADDEPMTLRRRDVQQIYALYLKHR